MRKKINTKAASQDKEDVSTVYFVVDTAANTDDGFMWTTTQFRTWEEKREEQLVLFFSTLVMS